MHSPRPRIAESHQRLASHGRASSVRDRIGQVPGLAHGGHWLQLRKVPQPRSRRHCATSVKPKTSAGSTCVCVGPPYISPSSLAHAVYPNPPSPAFFPCRRIASCKIRRLHLLHPLHPSDNFGPAAGLRSCPARDPRSILLLHHHHPPPPRTHLVLVPAPSTLRDLCEPYLHSHPPTFARRRHNGSHHSPDCARRGGRESL